MGYKKIFVILAIVLLSVIGYKIYNQPSIVYKFSKKESYKVLLIPYKGIKESDKTLIKNTLEGFYNVEVTINESTDFPKEAFVNIKTPRYRADKLIKWQKSFLEDYDFVLGYTYSDISTTKRNDLGITKEPASKYEDWGVMGLAYCPGKSCIISTYRLKNNNQKTFEDRLKKVIAHEFGHNLGLKHCPDKSCLMTDAVETVNTIDNAKFELCDQCQKQVKFMLKSH